MNHQCQSSLVATIDKYNMQNIDIIAEELFSKIRGRFPGVTIGDEAGNVTQEPKQARFFEFPFREADADVGKVSITLSEEDGVVVMHNKDVAENNVSKSTWYDFLKELRQFSKKRLLNFTTRDITKSNLEKRDYKYLAQRSGDSNMTESKLYGTSKISYQDVGEARLIIKHNESIDQTSPTGRNRSIGKIYVESPQGERFLYPYKHLSGARAMARHVAEGGNAYDDFGKHITSLSEELAKLRKFKNYMGRSSVMAESLSEYMDVVKNRVATVKKTIEGLQKPNYYKEAFESFETTVLEEVPSDVADNWVEQLTIKQFNEELKDVFPYIYKLVSEATKAQTISPEDLVKEAKADPEVVAKFADIADSQRSYYIMKWAEKKGIDGDEAMELAGYERGDYMGAGSYMWNYVGEEMQEKGAIKDKYLKTKEEADLENGFEEMMGQFADESFDPAMEPSRQAELADELMTAYEKGGEEELAKAMGLSIEELDQEINEYGMEHGLHADDDRDDIIQGVIEQMIDNMDEGNTNEGMGIMSALDAILKKDPGDEGIGYVFDKFASRMSDEDADELAKQLAEFYPEWYELHYQHEGNAYAHAVKKAKMNGKKKGDKIDGPDGDEITLEKDEKTPLGEFILSYYDRETGEFPKGETAVLTMVEKDYGEEFIEPAKTFIEKVNQTFEEFQMRVNPQQMETDSEYDRMRELAGLR